MALTLIDNGSQSIDDTGGEQRVLDTIDAAGAYVYQFSIAGLADGESVIFRWQSKFGGGSYVTFQEVTLQAGTDPDGFVSLVLPASVDGSLGVTFEPVGFAADRSIAFAFYRL